MATINHVFTDHFIFTSFYPDGLTDSNAVSVIKTTDNVSLSVQDDDGTIATITLSPKAARELARRLTNAAKGR